MGNGEEQGIEFPFGRGGLFLVNLVGSLGKVGSQFSIQRFILFIPQMGGDEVHRWETVAPGLEDVFITLMSGTEDNFQ